MFFVALCIIVIKTIIINFNFYVMDDLALQEYLWQTDLSISELDDINMIDHSIRGL